jgi:hypothetical protein
MKKTFLLSLLTALSLSMTARSGSEFQIRAGLGWAVYGTKSTYTLHTGIGDFESGDEGGAVTVHLPLELRYAFNKRINAGLDFKFGSYLYDPDSASGKSNRFVVAGIAGEFSFIARERFRWYGGLGFNSCGLVLEETDEATAIKTEWTYSGGGFKVNTGVLVFLVGGFGLNLNVGLDNHNLQLREYKVNGNSQSLDYIDADLKIAGVDGTIGLFMRF